MTANFKNLAANQPMTGQSGPLILDHNLQPVWFDPIGVNALAANLQVQSYNGKPALSWWQGVVSASGDTTSGEDVVVDQHYRHVATLKGTDGWVISQHEMLISGQNAWVTAYKNVPMNLTRYGGSANGVVLDSAVQEYNLASGQLLYTWDALNPGGTPNVPLSQSKQKAFPGIPWDAYHINSIQLTGNETFLVSLRNTWSAYLVNRTTNAIEWTLSGNPKLSTFALPANAEFEWQHDVQLHGGNVVSVFDDACCGFDQITSKSTKFGKPSGPTRGLVLKLNLTNHTGSLVAQYPPSQELQRGLPRQHAAASGRQRGARMGFAAVLLRGQQQGQGAARRVLADARPELPHVRRELGRDPLLPTERRGSQQWWESHGVRELGWRYPGRRLESPGGYKRPEPEDGGDEGEVWL